MTNFDTIFGQPSARVVALTRVGLAAVFYLGTIADPPTGVSPLVIPVLTTFFSFAVLVAVLTWNDWWLDARIALITHAIDICLFVAIVASPEGYSSPYFLFFVFLLLSPAIRWTWRETAATAAVVVVLYVVAGLLLGWSAHAPFDARRFIIRSGYLLILSVVLIWFGVRRRFATASAIAEIAIDRRAGEESPFLTALRQSMRITRAAHSAGWWTSSDGRQESATATRDQLARGAKLPEPGNRVVRAFLFDADKDRALSRSDQGAPQFTSVGALIGQDCRDLLHGHQGIGIPIDGRLGQGLLLLWGIKGLHSDHLALGDRLHSELPYLMERSILLSAMREGAIARERVALARDLHDGVVQFLAGSAYKIEAISRSPGNPPDVTDDLQELKQLMLLEQEDLRASIGVLRADKVSLDETRAEADALCKRLARQWRVHCRFTSRLNAGRISARLHMDLLNMIRESVANAARHASASNVAIGLMADAGDLQLVVSNDVGERARKPATPAWSIKERVAELGGTVTIVSEAEETVVRVTIPLREDLE